MGAWEIPAATDPRAVHAPEVLAALQASCASVRAASDPALLELARLRLVDLLGDDAEAEAPAWGDPSPTAVAELVSWPTSAAFDDRARAALALTEQFAIDVTGVPAGPLGAAAGLLDAGVLPFVQGLYLLDVGQRAAIALGALFASPVPSGLWAWPAADGVAEADATDPMAAVDVLLRATGRLRSLDPVLRELVRLRGARHHQCRRCQSVRSVAALEAGAGEDLLGAADATALPDLPPATKAALRLTDAMLAGRPSVPDDVVADVHASLSAAEAVELVCYLVRNSANKIAVAFGADAPIVDDGFEYQLIDPDGDTVTVAAPPAVQ
jgi:alkylhydroperoxidase family enzyme